MLVTTTAQWYYRFPSCAFLGFPTTEKKKSPGKDNSKSPGFIQVESTTCQSRHKANQPGTTVKLCDNKG